MTKYGWPGTDEEQFRQQIQHAIKSAENQAAGMLKDLKTIKDDAAEARRYAEILSNQNVLDWLCNTPTPSDTKHSELRQAIKREWKKKEGHGLHRFLKEETYSDWKKHPQSVLWLHAPRKQILIFAARVYVCGMSCIFPPGLPADTHLRSRD